MNLSNKKVMAIVLGILMVKGENFAIKKRNVTYCIPKILLKNRSEMSLI